MADAVVANASPLILLSRAGCLDLLRVVGEPVVVSRPVLAEIEMKGPNDITVEAMSRTPWLIVVPPSPVPPELAVQELGTGEGAGRELLAALIVGSERSAHIKRASAAHLAAHPCALERLGAPRAGLDQGASPTGRRRGGAAES